MSKNNLVTVDTENGPVRGHEKTSILGRNFFSFQGIPYMKAPLGKLRFRDAQPPENWTEPFDATKEIPTYCRSDFFGKLLKGRELEGQEDAGVINVFTPYIHPKNPLPVMVWIHGGGFMEGSSSTDLYGPDYFMQKDVVLVTFNYRIGPMGFMSLKDPALGIPGNAGLKDQTFALKWVQKNIGNFGGDKENVTIFGESAGGSSAHFHMISNHSKNLFKRAIVMSGCTFSTWSFSPQPLDWPEKLARKLGWNGNSEAEMLEFFENCDPFEIVSSQHMLFTPEESLKVLFAFAPVIEPYESENCFISKNAILSARDAWSKDVDFIIGATSSEGLINSYIEDYGEFNRFKNAYDDNPANFVPFADLNLDKNSEKAKKYGEKIRKIYFGEGEFTRETAEKFYDFLSDYECLHGNYRALLSRLNSNGSGKNFMYRFDVDTSLNICKRKVMKKEYPGACHLDDVFYLFTSIYADPPKIESKEFDAIKVMIDLWTSFAATGTPTTSFDLTWNESFKADEKPQVLNITTDIIESAMISMPEFDRLKVWNEIYCDANVDLF